MKKGTTDVVDENTYSLEKEKIDIFPNPASDKITIRIPEKMQGTAQYTITDQIGKVIEIGKLSVGNEQSVLSLGNISDGLYRIMIETNQTSYSKNLIISH